MGLFRVKLTRGVYWGGAEVPIGTVFTVYDVKETHGTYFLVYISKTWHWIEGYDCAPFEATDEFDAQLKELVDGH